MKRLITVLAVVAAFCAIVKMAAYASGTSSPVMQQKNPGEYQQVVSLYDQGVAAGKNNDFKKAVNLFEKALKKDKNNPDTLNMLAHAQRKTGLIDKALENYKRALDLRPNFPEAREYLGEAYIQAALRELDTLKSYGKSGEEQAEDLTKDFVEGAENLKDSKKDAN